jgi:hypothetical protein
MIFFNSFSLIPSASFPQIKQLSFQLKSVERILRSTFLGGEYGREIHSVFSLYLYMEVKQT